MKKKFTLRILTRQFKENGNKNLCSKLSEKIEFTRFKRLALVMRSITNIKPCVKDFRFNIWYLAEKEIFIENPTSKIEVIDFYFVDGLKPKYQYKLFKYLTKARV